jgi:hypothetical protein
MRIFIHLRFFDTQFSLIHVLTEECPGLVVVTFYDMYQSVNLSGKVLWELHGQAYISNLRAIFLQKFINHVNLGVWS